MNKLFDMLPIEISAMINEMAQDKTEMDKVIKLIKYEGIYHRSVPSFYVKEKFINQLKDRLHFIK